MALPERSALLHSLLSSLAEYNILARKIKQAHGRPQIERLDKLADLIDMRIDSITQELDRRLSGANLERLGDYNDVRFEREILRSAGFNLREVNIMIKRCLDGPRQPGRIANTSELKRMFMEHHQALIGYAAQLKLRGFWPLSPQPFRIDSYRIGMFGLSTLLANLVEGSRYSVSYTLASQALAILSSPLRIEPGVEGLVSRRRTAF